MTADEDPRVSDEATGLPPLEIIEPDVTIVVLAWMASEGIAALSHDGVADDGGTPCRYLHLRGITVGGPTGIEWVQIHVAIPTENALDVAAALAKGTTDELG